MLWGRVLVYRWSANVEQDQCGGEREGVVHWKQEWMRRTYGNQLLFNPIKTSVNRELGERCCLCLDDACRDPLPGVGFLLIAVCAGGHQNRSALQVLSSPLAYLQQLVELSLFSLFHPIYNRISVYQTRLLSFACCNIFGFTWDLKF